MLFYIFNSHLQFFFLYIFYRTLIVNGLFGIADEENNVENTTASPEFSNDINMEAEVVDTIMDKL